MESTNRTGWEPEEAGGNLIYWASMQENLSSGFVNNKGADQPAHLRRLISTFLIRSLESNISKLATS